MKKAAFVLLIVLAAGLMGCNSGAKVPENLVGLLNSSDPLVRSTTDPDVSLGSRRTFIILPASATAAEKPAFGDPIVEKRIAFLVRCAVEAHGYTLAGPSEQPDIVVTLEGSNEYRTSYIPPRDVTVPQYIPSRTVESTVNTNGTVRSGYDYGNYTENTTVQTRTPGRWTTTTVTRPGYEIGSYYPVLSLTFYDAATKTTAWSGSAVGVSNNPDPRVSCQQGLAALFRKAPTCETPPALPSGRLGIAPAIVTLDGDNTYPLIVDVDKTADFLRSGGRLHDVIAAVDGQSCANRPFVEFFRMLGGEVGTTCTLTLIRGKKVFDVTVKRVPRQMRAD